jgi:hypothetical protein
MTLAAPRQYMVYNAILRRWPEDLYRRFADRHNLFSTTIAVLVRERPAWPARPFVSSRPALPGRTRPFVSSILRMLTQLGWVIRQPRQRSNAM